MICDFFLIEDAFLARWHMYTSDHIFFYLLLFWGYTVHPINVYHRSRLSLKIKYENNGKNIILTFLDSRKRQKARFANVHLSYLSKPKGFQSSRWPIELVRRIQTHPRKLFVISFPLLYKFLFYHFRDSLFSSFWSFSWTPYRIMRILQSSYNSTQQLVWKVCQLMTLIN